MQPQLLKIPLNTADVVFTPAWVARDMVEFFNPAGRILEPCAGDNVFMDYLPAGADWCEITRGRDFFAWSTPVDWIIGNPPYSAFGAWIYHAMNLAQNVVFLVPTAKPFYSEKLVNKILAWGGLRHNRVYGAGSRLGFPIGFCISALHFERGYNGPMYTTKAAKPT